MHAVKSSAVLITFLGKTVYQDTSYRYPDDYTHKIPSFRY